MALMPYNDAIRTKLTFLPSYHRWAEPFTREQRQAWQQTGIRVETKSIRYTIPNPILLCFTDQRSKNAKVRRYNAWHRAAGLCVSCPNPAGNNSKLLCDKHHAIKLAWQRASRG